MSEDIIDKLFSNDIEEIDSKNELVIPKKCYVCKNITICSVLPTLMSLAKIKILVGIESCIYFNETKSESNKNNKTIR